jgi:fumarylacetoacetase
MPKTYAILKNIPPVPRYSTDTTTQQCTDIIRPGTKVSASFFNMPLGYSGRASSVVSSGTPVRRPRGQFVTSEQKPKFGPCEKLDFEVEFAAVIGKENELGQPIDVKDAEEHIFGCVLLNDWSARDIQMAESTPLGPFNGKNFSTSISPWIVTLDALEPYRTKSLGSVSSPFGPHAPLWLLVLEQLDQKLNVILQTPLLPYLQDREDAVYDIAIDVHLQGTPKS